VSGSPKSLHPDNRPLTAAFYYALVSIQRYPNFRRAQRERGPFYKGPLRHDRREQKVLPLIVGLSAVTFCTVFFSDRIPGILNAGQATLRNAGRENAPPTGAYYSGCNDARAAGVAPLYRGEPGYRPEMDGDSDGIACEPYRGR
jgi:Excalibur calcium-binding domain